MQNLRLPFVALAVCFTFAACGGDSVAPVVDTDGDGILDTDDPTPNGSTANHLNGQYTGGAASVVAITWYDSDGTEDANEVYDDDLTTACAESWGPQGTLCDESPTTDDPSTSTKTEADSGATWDADGSTAQSGTGVLVVDACFTGACEVVDFNEARVFQMYSDGKATHVRIHVHPERGATPPAWSDAAWEALTDFELVGEGTDVNADELVGADPTIIPLAPGVSRYFRFDVQNDGRYGDARYIELRSVKLYSLPLT